MTKPLSSSTGLNAPVVDGLEEIERYLLEDEQLDNGWPFFDHGELEGLSPSIFDSLFAQGSVDAFDGASDVQGESVLDGEPGLRRKAIRHAQLVRLEQINERREKVKAVVRKFLDGRDLQAANPTVDEIFDAVKEDVERIYPYAKRYIKGLVRELKQERGGKTNGHDTELKARIMDYIKEQRNTETGQTATAKSLWEGLPPEQRPALSTFSAWYKTVEEGEKNISDGSINPEEERVVNDDQELVDEKRKIRHADLGRREKVKEIIKNFLLRADPSQPLSFINIYAGVDKEISSIHPYSYEAVRIFTRQILDSNEDLKEKVEVQGEKQKERENKTKWQDTKLKARIMDYIKEQRNTETGQTATAKSLWEGLSPEQRPALRTFNTWCKIVASGEQEPAHAHGKMAGREKANDREANREKIKEIVKNFLLKADPNQPLSFINIYEGVKEEISSIHRYSSKAIRRITHEILDSNEVLKEKVRMRGEKQKKKVTAFEERPLKKARKLRESASNVSKKHIGYELLVSEVLQEQKEVVESQSEIEHAVSSDADELFSNLMQQNDREGMLAEWVNSIYTPEN